MYEMKFYLFFLSLKGIFLYVNSKNTKITYKFNQNVIYSLVFFELKFKELPINDHNSQRQR